MRLLWVLLILSVLAPESGRAQTTFRWDPQNNNPQRNWSTANNWAGGSGPAPANNEVAAFVWDDPNKKLNSTNDRTGIVMTNLTFTINSGAATLEGNAITLSNASGSIVNNSANLQTLNFSGMTLGTAFTINAAAGNIQVNSPITNGGNLLTVTGPSNTTLSGIISGTGGLSKLGGGTLTLSGANTYSGTTAIGAAGGAAGGTLVLGANNVLPNTAVNVYGGTLDANTRTDTIGALSLGGGASGTTAQVLIGSGGTLTLGGTVSYDAANNPNGAVISGAGTLALGGDRIFNVGDSSAAAEDLAILTAITGANSLTKNGNGVLLLAGTNTYSGQTILNAGTVLLNNGGSNAVTGSSIQINSGATLALGADNQIGNSTSLILNGGTFRAGTASAGYSDTLGTLTLLANSTLDLGSFTGTHSITFANSSAIAWTPGAVLTISNWQGLALNPGDAGRIFFGTNGLTSTQLAQVVWAPQGLSGATLIGTNGELTPIPEARVVWAGLALALAIGWKERRRIGLLFRR